MLGTCSIMMVLMKNGFRVFDTHTHIGTALHSGRRTTADDLLRAMDAAGVDRAVAIPFPMVADYRAEHDEIARAVAAHGDRFTGAACIDPFLPDEEFRTELKRCTTELGFRALKLQPQYHGLNPISKRAQAYFEAACEYNVPVICHTGTGAPFALPSLFIVPARAFPGLKIILGHSGGSVYSAEAIVAATVCPNIYLDLSSLMPHHITEVLAHVAPSRLMIGSDVPESMDTEVSKIFSLPMSSEDCEQILWKTASTVFLV
jgi:predicted TIM-barrel fold metal-dependent hydrolase